jgi:disulfide bond formation protein DsbB
MQGLGIEFDSASYKRGEALFATTCVACHLPDGGARPKLGKDVVHSAFTAGKTDKELMMFLKMGRNPGDPANTTGVDMPPKGGNPALMDKDLTDLITFIRGRQAVEDVTFSR